MLFHLLFQLLQPVRDEFLACDDSAQRAEQRPGKRQEADDYFKQYNWSSVGATYTDLERFLRTKGVTSNRKIGNLFNVAMEANIIYKNDKKKYYYNGLHATPPNDKAEDLPFEKPAEDGAPF